MATNNQKTKIQSVLVTILFVIGLGSLAYFAYSVFFANPDAGDSFMEVAKGYRGFLLIAVLALISALGIRSGRPVGTVIGMSLPIGVIALNLFYNASLVIKQTQYAFSHAMWTILFVGGSILLLAGFIKHKESAPRFVLMHYLIIMLCAILIVISFYEWFM